MMILKLRNTSRDTTHIRQVQFVDVRADGTDYVIDTMDADGKRSEYRISKDGEYDVAFVEGSMGATTHIVRPNGKT